VLETITLAVTMVSLYYGMQAGGPIAVWRVVRHPHIHWGWKAMLVVCLLPWPGPFDGLAAAAILRHLHLTHLAEEE
jgi:hypothetical protein